MLHLPESLVVAYLTSEFDPDSSVLHFDGESHFVNWEPTYTLAHSVVLPFHLVQLNMNLPAVTWVE